MQDQEKSNFDKDQRKFMFDNTTREGFSERERVLINYRTVGLVLRFWPLISVAIAVASFVLVTQSEDHLGISLGTIILIAAGSIFVTPLILKAYRIFTRGSYRIRDDEE